MIFKLQNISEKQNIVDQFEDFEYNFPVTNKGDGWEIRIEDMDELLRFVDAIASDWKTDEGVDAASIEISINDDEDYVITIVDYKKVSRRKVNDTE